MLTFEQKMTPIWDTDTIWGESLMMVREADGTAAAPLPHPLPRRRPGLPPCRRRRRPAAPAVPLGPAPAAPRSWVGCGFAHSRARSRPAPSAR